MSININAGQPNQIDILSAPETLAEINEFNRRVTDMHALLMEMNEFLKRSTYPKETSDIFETVTLYKPGFGKNWIPSRFQRQYMRIAAVVPTAINVSSFLGPPVVITIPAIAPPGFWNVWDWPDQTSIYLDATATANQMYLWVRFTNVTN